MDAVSQPVPVERDELTLAELLDALWRKKWLILCFAVLCAAGGAVVGWLMPKRYQATIVVSPMTDSSQNAQLAGLSSLLSQFGGSLASLAGMGTGDTKRAESITVLQSELLTERYIEQNNLLPVLYEHQWDARKQAWNETDPTQVPTLWKANEYFKKKIRDVTMDTKSGIVSLSITWKDPQVAARWANDLVKITNDYLRKKAIDESQRNIAYLNEQAAKTDVVQAKQAIYAILQTEINKEMLARGSEEYAFKILDPAKAPEKPSSPQWWLLALAGVAASLGISVLIAFVRVAWARN